MIFNIFYTIKFIKGDSVLIQFNLMTFFKYGLAKQTLFVNIASLLASFNRGDFKNNEGILASYPFLKT